MPYTADRFRESRRTWASVMALVALLLESADLYLTDNRNLVIALSQKSAEIEIQRIKIERLERILSRFL